MGQLACSVAASLLAIGFAGCGDSELGPCNDEAARELVYSRRGLVATKGQALAHDSCGNGAFCHSAAADDRARLGAPKGMDFDMLPDPDGLAELLSRADTAWELVDDGAMPPREVGPSVAGDGGWSVDIEHHPDAPTLPPLSTAGGRAAFRNWLACGAPVVVESELPQWAQPPLDPFVDGGVPSFGDLYRAVFEPSCATAGCHNAQSSAGGLAMPDACRAHEALFRRGACGEAPVRAGDAEGSLLIDKLASEDPACGDPMPPTGPLREEYIEAIRAWIEAGAEVDECG